MRMNVEKALKGMTAAPVDLPRLETMRTNAKKRLARAKAKMAVAEAELRDAEAWLERCEGDLDDWVSGRSQPQIMMF
jgi:hypothetical protein